MNPFDLLSLIPVLIVYLFIPIYFYYQNQLLQGFYIIIAIIALTTFVEGIKKLTPKNAFSWMMRPENACNCNLFNMGGAVGFKPGFPSGHTATATFLWVVLNKYFAKKYPQYQKEIYYGLLIMVISTMFARYMKSCHNIQQIIGGFLIGFIAGTLFNQFELL